MALLCRNERQKRECENTDRDYKAFHKGHLRELLANFLGESAVIIALNKNLRTSVETGSVCDFAHHQLNRSTLVTSQVGKVDPVPASRLEAAVYQIQFSTSSNLLAPEIEMFIGRRVAVSLEAGTGSAFPT
jgi:hypothetical protein